MKSRGEGSGEETEPTFIEYLPLYSVKGCGVNEKSLETLLIYLIK